MSTIRGPIHRNVTSLETGSVRHDRAASVTCRLLNSNELVPANPAMHGGRGPRLHHFREKFDDITAALLPKPVNCIDLSL